MSVAQARKTYRDQYASHMALAARYANGGTDAATLRASADALKHALNVATVESEAAQVRSK